MAMHAGKPVYVEKPLAASYEDCVRINRISEQTGVPCFVAYYRRYLPYFNKVKQIVSSGQIGKVVNVQIRFAVPPRAEDLQRDTLPWRLQPEIAGGGYFYDLAPHQFDLLQEFFGVITEASGICTNRADLYQAEDTVNACFQFESGLTGSGSWCFVAHESAREDFISLYSIIVLFSYIPKKVLRNLPYLILLMYNCLLSKMWLTICKERVCVSVRVFLLRPSTGSSTEF